MVGLTKFEVWKEKEKRERKDTQNQQTIFSKLSNFRIFFSLLFFCLHLPSRKTTWDACPITLLHGEPIPQTRTDIVPLVARINDILTKIQNFFLTQEKTDRLFFQKSCSRTKLGMKIKYFIQTIYRNFSQ